MDLDPYKPHVTICNYSRNTHHSTYTDVTLAPRIYSRAKIRNHPQSNQPKSHGASVSMNIQISVSERIQKKTTIRHAPLANNKKTHIKQTTDNIITRNTLKRYTYIMYI